MVKGACTNLFFPSGSVADFVQMYIGKLPDKEMMELALVGKTVLIANHGSLEAKVINLISNDKPATASVDHRHEVFTDEARDNIKVPDLWCLNVGTEHRPVLVSAEMCQLAQMQSFKRPYTQTLSNNLAKLRYTAETPEQKVKIGKVWYGKSESDAPANKRTVFGQSPSELTVEQKDEQLQTAFQAGGPNILFVEVGSKRFHSSAWLDLCKELPGHEIFKKNGMTDLLTVDPLFLQYESSRNQDAQWTAQLKAFKDAHVTDKKKGRKTILVIGLQDDKDRKAVYNRLKPLCDVEVGVQSYFVYVENVEKKVQRFPETALRRWARSSFSACGFATRRRCSWTPPTKAFANMWLASTLRRCKWMSPRCNSKAKPPDSPSSTSSPWSPDLQTKPRCTKLA